MGLHFLQTEAPFAEKLMDLNDQKIVLLIMSANNCFQNTFTLLSATGIVLQYITIQNLNHIN